MLVKVVELGGAVELFHALLDAVCHRSESLHSRVGVGGLSARSPHTCFREYDGQSTSHKDTGSCGRCLEMSRVPDLACRLNVGKSPTCSQTPPQAFLACVPFTNPLTPLFRKPTRAPSEKKEDPATCCDRSLAPVWAPSVCSSLWFSCGSNLCIN